MIHQTSCLEVLSNLLANHHAVKANVDACSLADGAVRIEDVYRLKVVRLAKGIVVNVMGWRNLQTASTELYVHVTVFDNRNNAVYEWHDDLVAAEPAVLWVFRVDTHRGIAHDGLRTRRCHDGVIAFLVLMPHLLFAACQHYGIHVGIGNIILQMIELGILLAVYHLLGREHRLGLGIPVHHAQAAIDVALLIEVYEHLHHRLRAQLVHREGRTVPVTRGAEFPQLLEDDAAVLACPLPGMLKKLLTREVTLLDALLSQLVHHLGLCSDRGVVGARNPARILSVKAGLADKDVLNGVVEHVAHVEHTRDVRRRNHYGIWFTVVRLAGKEFVVSPILIPSCLHLLRRILTC